jgi:quinol monooxygenase YgiN
LSSSIKTSITGAVSPPVKVTFLLHLEDRLCRKEAAMIVLRIGIHVLPEKQKEVVQTLLSLTAPMGREAGCLSHALLCDMKDKNHLCVLEEWEDREKMDRRLKSDMFGVLLGTKSLLFRPLNIHIYTVEQSEGMDAVIAARGKRDNDALKELVS